MFEFWLKNKVGMARVRLRMNHSHGKRYKRFKKKTQHWSLLTSWKINAIWGLGLYELNEEL